MNRNCCWVVLLLVSACAQAPDPERVETVRMGLELKVPGDYATIQSALGAATNGDTVLVAPGEYTGNVTLFDGVMLQGSGPATTILRGHVRFFGSNGAGISGFTVTAQGAPALSPDIGISVDGEIFSVTNNVVEGFTLGIGVDSTVEGVVAGNLVRNSVFGIQLNESADVQVHDNVVTNNNGAGIILFSECFASIAHNTVVGNGFAKNYDSGGAGIVVGPMGIVKVQNNVVVSNKGGLNAVGGKTTNAHHNLIWGNVDNYVGSAVVGAGDLSLDPLFVDAGNKNFRLKPASPAVDVGLSLGFVADFDGNIRPVGAAPDLGAFEVQAAAEAGDFVISEVMANPLNEGTGEFVELYNPTEGSLDAAGLVLDDGDSKDTVQGWKGGPTSVPAGTYAVILDADYPQDGTYVIPPQAVLLTVGNSTLGSGLSTGDTVVVSRKGAVVSTYLHPFDPGNGVSAERIDVAGDDLAGNWVPSPCGSSPGKANCISAGGGKTDLPTLIITEVMASPANQTSEEFVELYNFGDQVVELTGLLIADAAASDKLVAVAGKQTLLQPGQFAVIIDPDLKNIGLAPYFLDAEVPVVVAVANSTIGNGLTGDDSLTLLAADGKTVVATFSRPMFIKEQSVERIDLDDADVLSNWMSCPCPEGHSAGRPNCAFAAGGPVPAPVLVITEVMANPLGEDKGEFIEIYNPGDASVNLDGLVFTDGDSSDVIEAFQPGGSTVIPAKSYGVILDPEYGAGYVIPAGTALMRPKNTTLGNGLGNDDPVTLLALDGKTVISSFSFPFNAGNGISVELKGDAGDVKENWVASTCASGSSPGVKNCAAGGGAVTPEVPSEAVLVVSEVMANPLDESTGEFVEVVNVGEAAVDLAGWVLSDGDATDILVGFQGGPTTLSPGGYAVVLDSQYLLPGPYVIPAQAIRLTTGDKTLGSGLAVDDPVTLLKPDGVTVACTYANPFDPGSGFSAERIVLAGTDEPGNWAVSSCESGSSPGAANCAGGGPPAFAVVDVNTAAAADLQQVAGIGPSTASAIVAYRTNWGPYESLSQLTVLAGVTESLVAGWQVAEEGEAPFVIGLAGEKKPQVYAGVGDLLAMLPGPATPEAAAWNGVRVRIHRVAALGQDGAESNQQLLVGDWGDESAYEPQGTAQIPVFLDKAPGAQTYLRAQTDHADAMADWVKEDGDPFVLPLFYRWTTGLSGWGKVPHGSILAVEGVVELSQGAWRLRIRARADAGLDRVVLIERWLAADSWQELTWIWSYNYKPVVLQTTFGYTYTLPYRLAMAHPCRQYWLEAHGETITLGKVVNVGDNGAGSSEGWAKFNVALQEWKNGPGQPGAGYCFTHDSVQYCFSPTEEKTGLDILNKATFSQLMGHCYTASLANIVINNRPFVSIAAYDATSGVGTKSLWNLLVCYVRSGDWPPAPAGSIQKILQGTPGNEGTCQTVPKVNLLQVKGSLFAICDIPEGEYCIWAYSYLPLPPTLSYEDTVKVTGQVTWYSPGDYWELVLKEGCGQVTILVDNNGD